MQAQELSAATLGRGADHVDDVTQSRGAVCGWPRRRIAACVGPAALFGAVVVGSPLEIALRSAESVSALPARPAYLRWADEPLLGYRLLRATDPGQPIAGLPGEWGWAARHRYSSAQAWSADQALLAVEKGASGIVFLDGVSYRPLFRRAPQGACEWHPVQTDVMICVDRHHVYTWDVRRDCCSTVFASGAYSDLTFGPGKGNLSRDGRWIAVRARRSATGGCVAFALDITSGHKEADIALDALPGESGYVTISASGRYVLAWQKVPTDGGMLYHSHIFTANGTLLQSWLENHRPGHGDLTLDADGSDVMVGVSKSDPDRWRVIKRRLRDGKVTVLRPRQGLAQHVSARNVHEPGWIYVTYGGALADVVDRPHLDPFYQEIVAIRLDGSGESRPVTPTRSVRAGYLTEAHGSPSPDGSKVAFASNWGDADGPVALYVAEKITSGHAPFASIADYFRRLLHWEGSGR
jgi:hypothetical protein